MRERDGREDERMREGKRAGKEDEMKRERGERERGMGGDRERREGKTVSNLFFLAMIILHHLARFPNQMRPIRCLEDGGRYLGLFASHRRPSFSYPLGQSTI